MDIREITARDIPKLVRLFSHFVLESPVYCNFKMDTNKWQRSIQRVIDEDCRCGFVMVDGDEICGLLIGAVHEFFFTSDRIAYENIIYVAPEYRNLDVFTRLLRKFEEWGKNNGARFINIGTSASIKADKLIRLYEHYGYKTTGNTFHKRLVA